ncbi:MAG: type 1 glutamine amidotransferase domain-containing protein [Thermoplasmata archaeon]
MAEKKLENVRVAILATDGFEEAELFVPKKALEAAGAKTVVIAPKAGKIEGMVHSEKGKKVTVDLTLDQADPKEFDALVLPGGAFNADALRVEPRALEFVRQFDREKKPMAVICHAPWLLVSAGVVKDRTLTSYHTIQDDIRNAGGKWVDQPLVRDGNWVTSRQPDDLPVFDQAMIELFAERGPSQRGPGSIAVGPAR